MDIDQEYSGQQFIKSLLANIQCIICQHHYKPSDIRAIEHHDQAWMIAVTCSHCGTQGVILAVVEEVKESEIAELTPEEELAFQQMPSIDADEVLDVHEFLRDFNGDFEELFE